MSLVTISVDNITNKEIEGWAADDAIEEPVRLLFEVNGHVLREIICNVYRPDLESVRPHGRLGFYIAISPAFLAEMPRDATFRLVARYGGAAVTLPLQGQAAGAVSLHTDDGEYKSLNKDGYLTVRFKDMTLANCARGMAFGAGVAALLNDAGYPCFLAYGTLLGCVRSRSLIQHDDDVDLAVMLGEIPADAAMIDQSSIAACEVLRRAGYAVHRWSPGQIKLRCEPLWVDLFLGWTNNDRFYLNFAINGQIGTETIFPLQPVDFQGNEFLVPQDAELVCETLYGPDWKIPKADFRWQRAAFPSIADQDLSKSLRYWEVLYASSDQPVTSEPSDFARFVCREMLLSLPRPNCVIDIGCGDAADTAFLAGAADAALGIDGVNRVIERNRAAYPAIDFVPCNFNDAVDCGNLAEQLRRDPAVTPDRSCLIYSRCFLQFVDQRGEDNFIAFVRQMAEIFAMVLLAVEYRQSFELPAEVAFRVSGRAPPFRQVDANHLATVLESAGFMACDPVVAAPNGEVPDSVRLFACSRSPAQPTACIPEPFRAPAVNL